MFSIYTIRTKMNDDYESDDYETHKEFEKIKHLTLNDYLECEETYNVMNDEWEERFDSNIEEQLNDIFNKYFINFQGENCDFLSRANSYHSADLISLVKFHLRRDYTTDMFEQDPSLAKPLLNSLDSIMQKRKQRRKKDMKEEFTKANKQFSWSNFTK